MVKITNGMANSGLDGSFEVIDVGLTKREYFALEITKSIIRGQWSLPSSGIPSVAVAITDDLIEALK